jgi:sterol desaturase/sphingolipid hydroxylase (fatty acid hydroxylase superfamily)
MYISTPSLKNYVFVNILLIGLGVCQQISISYYEKFFFENFITNFFLILTIFLSRNYLLLNFIQYGTKNKPKIHSDVPKEDYYGEFNINILTTTSIESATHLLIKKVFVFHVINLNICQEILYFISVSFLFEVLFDLFHYIGHRILHNEMFYRFLHKKHHKFCHPSAITTFYQDPIDLILTNSIPTVMALYLIPSISYTQFNVLIVYKNFIEISGHSGKWSYPTSSFIQFMWLPKLLQIELYTEDHDLHHSLNNCNYSKRFALWDKVFKTYKRHKHL